MEQGKVTDIGPHTRIAGAMFDLSPAPAATEPPSRRPRPTQCAHCSSIGSRTIASKPRSRHAWTSIQSWPCANRTSLNAANCGFQLPPSSSNGLAMNKPLSNLPSVPNRRWRARSEDPTLPIIPKFQWPSAAIVSTPTPRSARGIVWIVGSMVVALVTAMALISIDQVVTTRGIVVSKARTIVVQPLETAIVRSIEVREGQEVQAEDSLAKQKRRLLRMRISQPLSSQVSAWGRKPRA